MDYNHAIQRTGEVVDAAGVAIMVVGAAIAAVNATVRLARHDIATYRRFRQQLGPHKTGKGCLYLNRLDDVDTDALRELISRTRVSLRPERPTERPFVRGVPSITRIYPRVNPFQLIDTGKPVARGLAML